MAEPIEYEATGWLRRTRSAVLLVVLVVILGALTAGVLGLLVVALASLVDHALG